MSLAGTQIAWTNEVTHSFGRLEEGYENALKDYYKKQIGMLNNLITLLLGTLTKGERQKVVSTYRVCIPGKVGACVEQTWHDLSD